jgi:cytochrome c oxidase assembly protein subunit 15
MDHPRFRQFAWAFVGYLVLVILFGAWVRIEGAGAGCGNHWPTCNGDIIPQAPETKTVIEFTHRVTSGLCGIFSIILVIWARRVSPRVFRAAVVTLLFVLLEGFIGAVLVKKELVAGDASMSRAEVIALHLVNTMALMAAASATAWWASPEARFRPVRAAKGMLLAMVAALILTNATGAVTALGDTLFPKQPALDGSLFAQVREDLSMGQHFLVRLRIVHPVVAVFSAMLTLGVLLGVGRSKQVPGTRVARLLKSGQHTVLTQLGLGVINIVLAAPAWMQILHLLTAQVLWMIVWLVVVETWPGRETAAEA